MSLLPHSAVIVPTQARRTVLRLAEVLDIIATKFLQVTSGMEVRTRQQRIAVRTLCLYFVLTSECVRAWTESAMRFCTPTFRISFATWAFTVRSLMPRGNPISLLERPKTNNLRSLGRSRSFVGRHGWCPPAASHLQQTTVSVRPDLLVRQ